jgi:DNA modification methylase
MVNHGNRQTNGQKPRTDERRGFDNRLDRADGKKNPRSVWTIPTQGYSEAHFATWPEALVERIIKAGCPEDGTVLDPFMGSGTTALVARRLGRKSIGIELNRDYADLCARRLQQLSLLA